MIDTQSCIEGWNYTTNALITAIGFGVTVLIGVNLWASLSITDKIEKILDNRLKSIRSEYSALQLDLTRYVNAISLWNEAGRLKCDSVSDIAIFKYLKCVEVLSTIKNKKMIDSVEESITNLTDSCLDNALLILSNTEWVSTKRSTLYTMRNVVEEILLSIEDKRSYKMYQILYHLFNED